MDRVKKIEEILSETDTCFGYCEDVKECGHTGHGCYLWKVYAKRIDALLNSERNAQVSDTTEDE